MDFRLTDEQKLMIEAARKVGDRFGTEYWRQQDAAKAFPKEFWNQISFVCEPTGHLIGWFRYERQGADFKAVNLGSFLASDDEWTAPIVAEVGPDARVQHRILRDRIDRIDRIKSARSTAGQ